MNFAQTNNFDMLISSLRGLFWRRVMNTTLSPRCCGVVYTLSSYGHTLHFPPERHLGVSFNRGITANEKWNWSSSWDGWRWKRKLFGMTCTYWQQDLEVFQFLISPTFSTKQLIKLSSKTHNDATKMKPTMLSQLLRWHVAWKLSPGDN